MLFREEPFNTLGDWFQPFLIKEKHHTGHSEQSEESFLAAREKDWPWKKRKRGVYEGEKKRYFDRSGMSVQAIGVDIIETERIRQAIAHWGEHFLFRIFTPAEVTYCLEKEQAHYSFAARFAVKEAVIKAIGTGLSSNLRWTSIEVVNDRKGKAEVRLGERVKDIIGDKKILISMSHTHQYAIGQAILIDEEK